MAVEWLSWAEPGDAGWLLGLSSNPWALAGESSLAALGWVEPLRVVAFGQVEPSFLVHTHLNPLSPFWPWPLLAFSSLHHS